MAKVSTGVLFLDQFLSGGYDEDIITTYYGPSGSGKTNLCLIAAVKMAESGKKVIFIDTEGGIATERIQQLTRQPNEVLSRILFSQPVTFSEQKEIFQHLKDNIPEDTGLILVDSISMLYRIELGQSEEVYEVNSALGKQIAQLVEIARRKKIPVLLTTQVYADFDNKDKVKIVGGDLLKYGSKCLIEIQPLNNCRRLLLKKHRSQPEGQETYFKIVQTGIEEVIR